MTMTDKTSTAPVMSLQQVRDALHEAHNSPGIEDVLDSCVAAIDAHLNAPTPDVVGGDVVENPLIVGSLPTYNQDPYPGLRDWWVQVWESRDEDSKVFARAYGNTPEQASERAKRIVAALAAQPKGATNQCQVRKDTQGLDDSGRLAPHPAEQTRGDDVASPRSYYPLNPPLPPHLRGTGDPADGVVMDGGEK